ncbi:MAG TPA: peptidylprolyl isomerase [Planctomycetota bacterium]|nr:peptidylprolyl isomerase [Planctomycetota bacterium]
MTKAFLAALAIVSLPLSAAVAEPQAGPDLTLTQTTDKSDYVLGEDVQAEVTLTNSSDKTLEVAELTFEERSLSFDVSFEAAPGKTKQFSYSIIKPDPHLMDRIGPARISLRPKKSLVGIFRIPILKTGALQVTAVYRGGEKEVRSAVATLKVSAADGASRLAAAVSTSKGDFQIDLLPEEAPNNVANFVSLVRRGFYNNMNFFRIIKGSWIQTGCPYDLGFGSAGYALKSEAEGQTAVHEAGTVAMSQNLKGGFTGSQFFIDLKRQESLDKKFTIIGRVPDSRMDVVKQIGSVDTDKNTDRPLKEDIRLKEIKIIVVK